MSTLELCFESRAAVGSVGRMDFSAVLALWPWLFKIAVTLCYKDHGNVCQVALTIGAQFFSPSCLS